MEKILEDVCASLDTLSDKILNLTNEDKNGAVVFGWTSPALDRYDLAEMPKCLSEKIRRNLQIEINDENIKKILEKIPSKIESLIGTSVPQLFNSSNAIPASLAITATIQTIALIINHSLFDWEMLQNSGAIPLQLKRKLKAIETELSNIVPEKDKLREQIDIIREAHQTAESLPTDLQSLKDAREDIKKNLDASNNFLKDIETHFTNSKNRLDEMTKKSIEAEKLVKQADEAYRTTTTAGLAGAFNQKANRLSWSMWIWVVGLSVALSGTIWIGKDRITTLTALINTADIQWAAVGMNVVLSLLSVGAPIWFAWLATKQIGQRFRLAEDYAFKASVAKAYEGYRREAARIDEDFEKRLFSSALTRLEEPPLRLIENESHGSPWHELFSKNEIKALIKEFPDLKNDLIEIIKEGISVFKNKKEKKTSDNTESK